MQQLLTGELSKYRLEKRYVHRDGKAFWVVLNVSLVRDTEGESKFFLGQVNNIQQRKELEVALRKHEELLDETGKLARVGGWDVDLETNRVYWTHTTKEIHEVPETFEPTVEDAIAFYVKEDQPVIERAIRLVIEQGKPFDLELRIVTAKGNPLWVHAIGHAEFSGGECIRVHGMFQDISEQRRQRDELMQKNAELERFTYTVSHDLKAPLVTIGGFVGLLERHFVDTTDQRAHSALEYIREATESMSALLSELLELSRAGRMVQTVAGVSMELVAHEAIETHHASLMEMPVSVRVAEGLPTVTGDKNRLVQVVQNLVGNAVKYLGDQPQPVIEIGMADSARGRAFYVQDNGVGIAAEYHEKAFGLFERLGAEGEGTGVGLALVRRIIELHGGETWIESQGAGKGTTVWFTLPLSA